MNPVVELSLVETIFVSSFLTIGAAFTLVGAFGLMRLQNFYARVHSPTLGTTVGTVCIATASMIYFTIIGTRLAVHELVAIAFVTVSTPVGLIILVRAALFREGSGSGRASSSPEGR